MDIMDMDYFFEMSAKAFSIQRPLSYGAVDNGHTLEKQDIAKTSIK